MMASAIRNHKCPGTNDQYGASARPSLKRLKFVSTMITDTAKNGTEELP